MTLTEFPGFWIFFQDSLIGDDNIDNLIKTKITDSRSLQVDSSLRQVEMHSESVGLH